MNFASYIILTIILCFFGYAVYKLIKKKGICSCGTIGNKTHNGCTGQCSHCACGCKTEKDVNK